MNAFTSPYDLPPVQQLIDSRKAQINPLINNLKIHEVEDEEIFKKTKARIKGKVLFESVTVGEPRLKDYSFEERPLSMQQQVMGGNRNHYLHEIIFPVTGDIELISYAPGSFTYSSSDRGLIIPYGSEIEVEIDLPELNPEQAIQQARNLLSMTFQFINSNNATVKAWNTVTESTIEQQLEKKREELNKVFGNKKS